jgi:hypothetical protein
MTLWPEQPAEASQPPQTRRQARENERTAARQAARRAGTSEPTPAGEIPDTSATPGSAASDEQQPPAIPASAFAEPGVSSPSGGGSFDSLLFSVPQRTDGDATTDASAFELFRQAPDPSKPQPVTQPMAVVTASAAPAAASAPIPSPSADAGDSTGERTLTRRELRAMLQAQAANQQANNSPAIADPVFPVTFTEPGATPTDQQTASAAAPVSARQADGAADTGVSSSPASAFTAFGAPTSSAPVPAAAAPATQPVEAADADVDADADEDVSAQERRPFTPPTGHWSTAAELEDGVEPITSRNVGHSTAATTTNALILPALPQADATGPLTSTGEILVTGSIDLPRTLGATGAHDRIDSSDIDRLLDGEENEFNTSEVAPVRASRAISTHTSTRGVIAPPKKRGNTLPVVLMVTAGVLAVGVIGLLIAAYVLNVF